MISVYRLFEEEIEPAFGAGVKKNVGGPGYLSTTQTAQGVPPPSIAKARAAAMKKTEEAQRTQMLLSQRAKKHPKAIPQPAIPVA